MSSGGDYIFDKLACLKPRSARVQTTWEGLVDLSVLVLLAAIGIGLIMIAWRNRGVEPDKIGPGRPPDYYQVGIDNTKAVEENTAAIRDLIRKLDERAPK